MRELPLRASVVGLTARCDRHVDAADVWTVLQCQECQRRIVERARAEIDREHRKGVAHDPRD